MCWLLDSLLNCGNAKHRRVLQLLMSPQATLALLCQVTFDAILVFPSETNKLRTSLAALQCHTSSHWHWVTEKKQQKGKMTVKINFGETTEYVSYDLSHHSTTTILLWSEEENKWLRSDRPCKEAGRNHLLPSISNSVTPLHKAYPFVVKWATRTTS